MSRRSLSSIPFWLSFLFKMVMVCGQWLVTLSLTINKTLKWLSLLPTLMQESFWWRQCSDRYIISLYLHPFLPISLLSHMVSVDITHHINYLYTYIHTHTHIGKHKRAPFSLPSPTMCVCCSCYCKVPCPSTLCGTLVDGCYRTPLYQNTY